MADSVIMMKWLKRIGLVIVVFVLLVQIPGIYNRIRLYRITSEIDQLDSKRNVRTSEGYVSYKGVFHIHSKIGGHSSGTIPDITAAAKKNSIDFVVMTEHTSISDDTSSSVFTGFRDGVLILGGHELNSLDENRYLILDGFPGVTETSRLPAEELIDEVNRQGSLAFVTHPERNKKPDIVSDGFEVFSLHTSIKKVNPPSFLINALWSYFKYPDLTMLSHFERPDENLRHYDKLAKKKKLSLFASTDAHSNIGLQYGGDKSDPWIDIKLDPYEETFRVVCTHVFIEKDKKLSRDTLIAALKEGRFFTGFDTLGNSDGFIFEAVTGSSTVLMGSEIELTGNLKLKAGSPLPGRFVVFRDGVKISESGITSDIEFDVSEKGAYRIEVYQDGLGSPFDKLPWIMSNPIYIR
jgi:hypothetical protein